MPCWPASTRFQSTHPRGVRHASLERVPHEALVSIHAPAWGATGAWIKGHARMSCFNPRTRVGCDLLLSVGFGGMEADVSIHAPAWGATNANESPFRLMKCFNSRTRVGCDEPDFDGWLERHGVSIHAPAWGATERKREYLPAEEMFKIRHRRGVRLLRNHLPTICNTGFNPRTRVGCDVRSLAIRNIERQFQSTHPRGVRLTTHFKFL